MQILITGSNGLVGSAAVPFLTQQGHRVKRLIRHRNLSPGDIFWNPPEQGPDPAALEGIDAVVHLAGESIAARWTVAKKQAIRDSRVKSTQLLVDTLGRMKRPPRVLVCASAIGYYGNHGDEIIRDGAPAGTDFLAQICQEWESAAARANDQGIRVVNLRFGVILSQKGGALGKMLPPFKLGLGGKIASGQQYMSWIALDDVAAIIQFVLTQESLRGPVNTVAPEPVTNAVFTRTLGRVLKRPTLFPMPAFAARLAFGEMANALLIGGARIVPTHLQAAGYAFRYPELSSALQHLLLS